MVQFMVPAMTCGNCARSIRSAIERIDSGAEVDTDVANRRVSVTTTIAAAATLADAIRDAGYEVEAVA